MTVQELITSSLRMIGQLGPGRGANATELVDALFVLNAMIDAWNTERLSIYAINTRTHALTGATSYSIGPVAADLIAPRPHRIESAYLVNGATRTELTPLGEYQWKRGEIGIHNDGAYPNSTLYLTAPIGAGDQLELGTWELLTAFAALTDTVALPPGYADALRYNLGVRLGIEWGKPASVKVEALAITSKAAIQSFNSETPTMECDSAVLQSRGFDWRTGR